MTDYVNYTLAKSKVSDMYIVGGQIGPKTGISSIGLKKLGLQKKTRITNADKSTLCNFLFNMFCCEINSKNCFFSQTHIPLN